MVKIIDLLWNSYLKLLYMSWNFYRKILNVSLQNQKPMEHFEICILKIILISLSKFNLLLIGTFTWSTPPGSYRATICRERELNCGSQTYFFDHTRTWRASQDEWSARCRSHLRDSTNMKDNTHQAHTHSYQQGEYGKMITAAKWYSGTLWA